MPIVNPSTFAPADNTLLGLLAASSGSSLVGNAYDASGSAALVLHDYIEDDGFYNVMGFVPQNLKSSIRNFTSIADVHTYAQSAISAGMTDGHGVRFPRGRFPAPGLAISGYTGKGLIIEGVGAEIILGSNEQALAISSSDSVVVRGLRVDSSAASGASQAAVTVTLSSRIRIVDNDFRLLTYGVNFVSSTLGLAISTSVPLGMSLISRNTINACATGILLAGSSNVTTAEYVSASGNMIDACTARGILVQAGNSRVSDNTVVGNIIGIEVDGSQYANADHGAVIGNTINHSSSCGLYVHDTSAQYSYLITGNNIWATIYTNLGAGNYAHPFGAVLKNCASINFTNNIVARNVVNLGIDGLTSSLIANNNFLTDSANTLFNIYEITAITVANGNRMAPNAFSGTLVASANNNDYEQTYNIGASGSPAFQNTWANFGSGFTTAAYRKDAAGFVHLSGVVSGGTMNLAIFTLPVNFRPLTNDFTQATVSNNLIGRVLVSHTGDVIPAVGTNTWFSIDGISFKAEA